MKNFSTKKLALVSVLSAVYIILAYISVGTNDFKVSFESLAVIISGSVLGPLAGFLTGLVGEFVHQITGPYGVDITTPLWLLPYAMAGLVSGLTAIKALASDNKYGFLKVIIPAELVLTLLITPVNWLSAIIQGWGNWVTIAAGIPLRFGLMAVRIIIDAFLVPVIYKSVKGLVK